MTAQADYGSAPRAPGGPKTEIDMTRGERGPDEPLVQCDRLSVVYSGRGPGAREAMAVQAVRVVDFSVAPGESIGILGESGSGKTTLAQTILGLQRPSAGSVRLGGSLAGAQHLGSRAAMIFQDPKSSLNPRLSVRSIVADPLIVHRRGDRAERQRRVAELLDAVGLPAAIGTRRARQLSGGQLQRVAIARALALDPDLVVADEPTSALDVSVQAQIVKLLRRLRQERRFALVIVSHDVRVVRALADRVVVMYDGLIVEDGPAGEVFETPAHPYTLTLLSSATAVGDGESGERADATTILSWPRPFTGRDTLQADCCPFAQRCWRAIDACLSEVPSFQVRGHPARCVSPVEEPDVRAARGNGRRSPYA